MNARKVVSKASPIRAPVAVSGAAAAPVEVAFDEVVSLIHAARQRTARS